MPKKLNIITGLLAVTVVFSAYFFIFPFYYSSPTFARVLTSDYSEDCLNPKGTSLPLWECYQFELGEYYQEHQSVNLIHENGDRHNSLTYRGKLGVKVRFTPDKPGRWCIDGQDICVEVQNVRPEYAKGFVKANGTKWIRSATGEAFIPQYLMYDKPDLETGIDKFVHQHGFTGFHIQNLRDFLEKPEYFEAVVLKTYRAGGVTHFWLWGDEERNQTPNTYGVDVNRLYHEIAARLAPLPGWTLGYGFDVYEWAGSEEISRFRKQLNQLTGYPHLIGARGHKNKYQEIAKDLDYASWEWHRPDYSDYKAHISKANGRPAFSEDRFRVRNSAIHRDKDYDFTETRRGLWRSLFAGGVANIWGYRKEEGVYSNSYPNQGAIRCYRDYVDLNYNLDSKVVSPVMEGGYCIKPQNNIDRISCYLEQVEESEFLIPSEDILDIKYLNTQNCLSGDKKPDHALSKKMEFSERSDWVVTLETKAKNLGAVAPPRNSGDQK